MLKDNLTKKLAEQGDRITRNMLASKAGISQASFSNIITGAVKNPGVYTMAKIAKELGCSIDELVGRKSHASQKTAEPIEQTEFKSEFALNSALAVLEALNKAKPDASFETLLELIADVYKYGIGKNSDTVDEYFTDWLVRHAVKSEKDE